jgi:asparagine synthase (glutamine-hydrolysing)
MCGIAGFNWRDENIVREMCDSIIHRGPDDEGYYTDESVSLGHRRLSIIDLSEKGHQPMSNEDQTVFVVYNGEIYNYHELREELIGRGHVFASQTDTEVIVHAYEEYGTECVKKFNGMWAFCIYDKTSKQLFLSRDRFGIKPLYYYFDGARFMFSSEIKPLLIHDIKIKPNESIIFDYLYYNLSDHTEETFFINIRKLKASHNMILDINTLSIRQEQYYHLIADEKNRKCKADEIKELFYDSVKKRLLSDVPVGSCLSGGLDSSSIVIAMSRVGNPTRIKTFSLTFPGEKNDESSYQKQVIELVGSESYFVSPTSADFLSDISDLIYTQEEPFTGTSVYGQYKVMELAHSTGMKVLLDGQGADEIFAGYHFFKGYYYYELLRGMKLPTLIREIKDYYSRTGSLLAINYLVLRLVPERLKQRIYASNKVPYLSKEFIGKHSLRKDIRWNISTLNEALIKSITIYLLPTLLRFEDKNSMRFSIESRVPFLDYRLVECSLSGEAECKIRHGITKYTFREAMKSTLPANIRCRFDKIGFATPEEKWFRSKEVQEFVGEIINSGSFSEREYWDASRVKDMYEDILKGKSSKFFVGTEIWRCISMELWLRMFIDKKGN